MPSMESSQRGKSTTLKIRSHAQAIDLPGDLVRREGGVFIGKEDLVRLGKLSSDTEIPAIPEKFNLKFLQSTHPLRGGTIASHVILAFDPESKEWICIDRGNGGMSDIVPGSLGRNGKGLSGSEQDSIIKDVNVEGRRLESPKDSNLVERTLNNAIALHMKEGKSIEEAPFYRIWGRTADTERGASGCRVLIGRSSKFGAQVHGYYMSELANKLVGLFAAWN